MFIGTRSTIKCWWNLVAARSTSGDLKLLSGISKSQTWDLCSINLREEEFVDSKLARGRVSKLLLEVEIDLGLNLL